MTSKHQHQINICASFKSSSSSLLLLVVVVVVLLLLLSVVDPGEGPGGHGSPPYFEAKLKTEGPKTFFLRPSFPPPHPFSQGVYDRAPPLSEMLDPPLIIILLLLIYFFSLY